MSLISTLARLPFDDAEVHRYACDAHPDIANAPSNEEYSTFWLVLADQFAKKGIDCSLTRLRALDIIARGVDIAMMRELGMDERSLRSRQQSLELLRERVLAAADAPRKLRKVLKKPQDFVMETGDCFAYPLQGYKPINPYFPSKEAQGWVHDGWGAMLVMKTGRTLGYLAWYRVGVVRSTTTERPTLEHVRTCRLSKMGVGTFTAAHLKRMEFERIGRFELRPDAILNALGESNAVSPDAVAINDISIANVLIPAVYPEIKPMGPLVAELF